MVSGNSYEELGHRYKNGYNSGIVSLIDFKHAQHLSKGVCYTMVHWHWSQVMIMSGCDANDIMALQEWEILPYCYSEASKQHRKILPCVPLQTTCTPL